MILGRKTVRERQGWKFQRARRHPLDDILLLGADEVKQAKEHSYRRRGSGERKVEEVFAVNVC